ncbi:SDR family NAD(P)-dependent oxidoreductase [Streptomyces sp. NPDC058145]|uniref:SDR family NAD(P)-dependent oxidoreductase n=1 Tax=Streptomyces sp. NPDC058145 TaxID=3346356 RepID=UPI0036E33C0A
MRHAREAVRFADAVTYLAEQRVSRFVELGPGALVSAVVSTLEDAGALEVPMVVSLLSRRVSEPAALVSGLGQLFVSGVPVSWRPWCAGGRLVDVPTYAFQRERYWLTPTTQATDVRSAGLVTAEHPLLGAVVASPGASQVVLTGQLSRAGQPWLADHEVFGHVMVPASALVELAVRAGDEVGCPVVRELAMTAPLLLPERGGVQVHVVVGEPDEAGLRDLEIHSRADAVADDGQGWVQHTQGVLAPARSAEQEWPESVWPPVGAETVDVETAYGELAEQGYGYGPAFRGVRAAWRRGGELFAEVSVSSRTDVSGFGIHPALLDAVIHAPLLTARDGGSDADVVRVPFLFENVSLRAVGASSVRVRIAPAGSDAVTVQVADESGAVVLEVGTLVTRPVSPEALTAAAVASTAPDGLFEMVWSPVPVPKSGAEAVAYAGWDPDAESVPPVVVWEWASQAGADVVASMHDGAHQALEVLQSWLASPQYEGSTLVVVTRGAVGLPGEAVTDVAASAVWGLVRSAQSENPGRIVLVDTDGEVDSALVELSEPQLVVRGGVVRAARLVRAGAAESVETGIGMDGAVIVTGGTGGVGGVLARRLVEAHGAGCVVLASRRGEAAEGVGELVADLEAAGATVRVVACDVSDRAVVVDLVGSVPDGFELRGVVHAAGVLDDGVIGSLTPERLDRVLAAKADAAWYLHEATRDLELALFSVVSSLSGVLGSPGQANYAAANTFLDGLAVHRRGLGLAGQSVSWGLWAGAGGMGGGLADEAVARLRAGGVLPLSSAQAVELFDAAMSGGASHVVGTRWDLPVLRRLAVAGELPAALGELVPAIRRTAAAGESVSQLVSRLRGLDPAGRRRLLTELVSSSVAAVLGYGSAEAVAATAAFRDLGLDSLGGVNVRNRLQTATGLSLPASLVFDYPTAQVLADFLLERLLPGDTEAAAVAPAIPSPAASGVDSDPVVVVGMGCRYPGGVVSPEGLWDLVRSGGEGVGEFPSDRGWDVEGLFDPDPQVSGKSYVRRGGFLADVAGFDAGFFGISPREAVAMDPQQRLLLEVCWEAIERAGVDPGSLRGSRTGVFAGVMSQDYAQLGDAAGDATEGFSTGLMGSVVSGRVSYVLGLEGPAVSVDTACSSSLVALHLAAQALRAGECDLALAGGVTVMATPETFVEFSRQRGLAVDGRCKAFAEGADGTGWGEGVGVLLLERLSDARRRGHPVLAVVAGSAVNQDGASNGLTAPNGPSQQRVIRAALASAGLSASDVDVVEAHGTGTVLGDPIEAQALLATYGQRPVGSEPLWLGSLKSNVGHTQAAAGVGGVIKMIEALRHGMLPRTLHVDAPSSHVDWTAGRVELLAAERAWPQPNRPRRAGVSSFGLSGTNAHVIIEQAPDIGVEVEAVRPEPAAVGGVWTLSAKSSDALADQAAVLADWLLDASGSEADHRDVALSLSRRSVFEHRAVVFGADRQELLTGLVDLAARREGSGVVAGSVRAGGLAFVFPGQGAQWLGMGRELAGAVPGFARELEVVAGVVDRWWDHRLLDVVWGSDAGLLERTEFTQPALFALEVALFRVVTSWGVVPDFVVGHSVGEIAAAHVAGMLSLGDAARLVVARGRVMQQAGAGVMTAVSGSVELVEGVLARVAPELGPVVVAAVNAPGNVVISGARAAVDAAAAELEGAGCRTRSLAVSHAFHSPLLEPVLEEFERVAAEVVVSAPTAGVGLVSNVTGEPADVAAGFGSAEYWVRHAREAVRFADAVTYLAGQNVCRFAELGPGALVSAVVSTLEDAAEGVEVPAVVPLLSRRGPESTALISGLGQLFVSGVPVSWRPWCAGGRLVDVPTYAFQRERYWLSPTKQATDVRSAGLNSIAHPMLGAVVALPGSTGVVLTGQLSRSAQPWLADHDVLGHVMVPASALVELAVRAGDEVGCPVVGELAVTAPLLLPERGGAQVHVVVGEPEGDALRTVEIHSRPDAGDGQWILHAQGTLAAAGTRDVDAWSEPVWPPVGAQAVDVEAAYQRLAKQGYAYGPVFQGVRAAWRRGEEVLAEVCAPAGTDVAGFGIHPALLDAVVHAPLLASADEEGGPRVPFLWEGASLHAMGASSVRVRIAPVGADAASVQVVDESGALVLSVDSLVTRPMSQEALAAAAVVSSAPDGLFEVAWREVSVPAADAVSYAAWDPDAVVVPPVVVWEWVSEPGADAVASMHDGVHRALEVVQSFLASPRCESSTLVVLTRGAVCLPGDDVTDVAASAVWGLVRSAQSENPGRIVLIDTEAEGVPAELAALGEPQLVVRGGAAHVARLVRAGMADPVDTGIGADGAVIVTGGTGGVGSVLARHLVEAHQAGCVVLASRRGAVADGVPELVADLEAAGATVRVVACDVSDRAAVVDLVGSVPDGFELRGVVHAAGVLDDGVIGSLTPERVDRVLAAKADAAWYLHEATRDLDLALFSVVSSLSGVLGSPGQANYAAANAFLDALAVHRRQSGLPGQSTSWGLWAEAGGMGAGLADEALARFRTGGVLPLSSVQAVGLFDAAISAGVAHLVGVRWDRSALRRLAGAGELAPMLADMVPAVRRTAAAGESVSQLEKRLRETDLAGRRRLLTELVSSSVAAVLGHGSAEAVAATAAFRDLGLDSLGGVNVRNRLQTATGLILPASLVFDCPTPQALAGFLLDQLMPGDGESSTAPTHMTDVRRLLQAVSLSRPGDSVIIERLLKLAEAESDWSGGEPEPGDRRESIEEMDVDALIDMGLGLSQSRKSDI